MAKDLFHDAVRIALEKEGWTVTDDPLLIQNKTLGINYEIDLGAERLIVAERPNTAGMEKIAVEVKTFLRASIGHEFHQVLGQYLVYYASLQKMDSSRTLFLALPDFALEKIEKMPFIWELVQQYNLKLIVFSNENQQILSWKQ